MRIFEYVALVTKTDEHAAIQISALAKMPPDITETN